MKPDLSGSGAKMASTLSFLGADYCCSMNQLSLAAKACHPTNGGDVFRCGATCLTLRVSK